MINARTLLRRLLFCVSMLAGLAMLAGPVQAQQSGSADLNAPMPRCGPQMDGQTYCKFGAIYECQFVNVNSMERRTGWLWKSDVLRSCDDPSPATLRPPEGLPPGFTYAPQYNNGASTQSAPMDRQNDDNSLGTQPSGLPYPGANGLVPQYRNYRRNY